MQVAAESPALLFSRGDDALARPTEVGRERDRVHCHGGLPREVVEQLAIGRGERLGRSTRADDEIADLRSVVDERKPQRGVDRPPMGHDRGQAVLARHLDCDIGHAHRLRDGLRDARQHLFGDGCRGQAIAEPREHLVGLIALAVQ